LKLLPLDLYPIAAMNGKSPRLAFCPPMMKPDASCVKLYSYSFKGFTWCKIVCKSNCMVTVTVQKLVIVTRYLELWNFVPVSNGSQIWKKHSLHKTKCEEKTG